MIFDIFTSKHQISLLQFAVKLHFLQTVAKNVATFRGLLTDLLKNKKSVQSLLLKDHHIPGSSPLELKWLILFSCLLP